METLRDDRNQPANEDGFISQPRLEFSDAQVADIAETLYYDWGFIQQARNDVKLIKDEKLLADLERYVPEKLWKKIKGDKNEIK